MVELLSLGNCSKNEREYSIFIAGLKMPKVMETARPPVLDSHEVPYLTESTL